MPTLFERKVVPVRLFRVIVPVGSIEGAAAFYARVLGTLGRRVSPGRHSFDCEGTILTCYDPRADGEAPPDAPAPSPNAGHIFLATDDLNGTRRRLVEQLGERGVGQIEDQPWGERTIYANDPWGNRLCFVDRGTIIAGAR